MLTLSPAAKRSRGDRIAGARARSAGISWFGFAGGVLLFQLSHAWPILQHSNHRSSAGSTVSREPRYRVTSSRSPTGTSVEGMDSALSPGPRNGHGLAYDLQAGVLLLFGGATADEVRGDTWLWKAGVWREAFVRGPSPRTFPAVTYDVGRAEVVLFGGNQVLFGDSVHAAVMLGDTWLWRREAWVRVGEHGPSARAEAAIAYDPRRKRTVLFGGYQYLQGHMVRLGDTWEWDGRRWLQVSLTGPPPRSGAAMAYDPSAGGVVLFGGSGGPRGDTWTWNGREWVQLQVSDAPGRFNTAMDWDSSSERLVRFGGWDGTRRTSDTWELRAGGWVRVQEGGPSPRNHTVLVSARDRSSVLLYGGHDGEMVFADLWERRNGRWIGLLCAAPIRRVSNGH